MSIERERNKQKNNKTKAYIYTPKHGAQFLYVIFIYISNFL